jgi:hypothetical protein
MSISDPNPTKSSDNRRTYAAMLVVMALIFTAGSALAQSLPRQVMAQLPPQYRVMTFAKAQPRAGYEAVFVVLAANREATFQPSLDVPSPARPVLLFERRENGGYRLAARNDHIVLRINDGGQCDPSEFGAISVRDTFVTFENSVACGGHWTDFVTFRFNPRALTYEFHNQRYQSLSFNPDRSPNAQALIEDPVRVVRAGRTPVGFSAWRPTRS